MLNRLMDLLQRAPPPTEATVGAPFARREIAVVALLMEAAQVDRRSGPEELAAVERIVRERFGFDAALAAELIATSQSQLAASLEDWVFAAAVREGFTPDERSDILGLLWEVNYADGRLARFEESLLRRLAAEIGVSEAECEGARARAFARACRASAPETE